MRRLSGQGKQERGARGLGQGDRIDETGLLVRDGGGFALRRDAGGLYRLELARTPIDHVEKRVRVTGILIADDLVQAEGVSPA